MQEELLHEWAICGTLLAHPEAADQLRDAGVQPQMLEEAHPRLLLTHYFQLLDDNGVPPSLPVLAREMLRGKETAEQEQIKLSLVRMRRAADNLENLPQHVDELLARDEERFLIGLLRDAYARLGRNPSRQQVEEIRLHLSDAAHRYGMEHGRRDGAAVLLRDSFVEGFQAIMANRENPDASRQHQHVPTGFACLDERYLSGGFRLGNLALIAGRPSHGKTQLGLKIGLNASRRGEPGIFISLEMAERQLRQRLFANIARVSMDKLLREDLTNEEIRRLWLAVTEGCMLRAPDGSLQRDEAGNPVPIPFYIVDKPAMRLTEIFHTLRRAKREFGITWAVIDYVQLIHLDNGSTPSRENEFSLISAGLRLIARTLGIALIGLIQVNRELENRQDKQPRMSDLRNSGAWEQDASYILTVMRPMVHDRDTDRPDDMDVSIEKNRFGDVGLETLDWNGPYQDVTDKPAPAQQAV